MTWFVLALFAALICAGIASSLGAPRNRHVEGTILGCLLGPLGILCTILLPPRFQRQCPRCCSGVADEATHCPHCAGELPAPLDGKARRATSAGGHGGD